MAFDSFLKIDDIDGESVAQGHEKWIELLSFSWGAVAAGNGEASGKVSPQAFTFTKVTDSASPKLFQNVCQGTHFDKVSVACRRADAAGAAQDDFVKIDFFDVFLSSYNEGGNQATDPRPLESISFAFAKIEYQVAPIVAGAVGEFSSASFEFKLR